MMKRRFLMPWYLMVSLFPHSLLARESAPCRGALSIRLSTDLREIKEKRNEMKDGAQIHHGGEPKPHRKQHGEYRSRFAVPAVLALALALILGLPACTHTVGFHPAKPAEEITTKTAASVKLYMRPELVEANHSFRAFGSGIANLWVVDYGQRVHDFAVTYLSAAFTDFEEVEAPPSGSDANVEIKDVSYAIRDQAAHVELDVTANGSTGDSILSKHYETRGWRGGGVVFAGGAFAQKGVTRSSTDQALKTIFLELIADLRSTLSPSAESPVDPDAPPGD
jgi:hypothetical protein